MPATAQGAPRCPAVGWSRLPYPVSTQAEKGQGVKLGSGASWTTCPSHHRPAGWQAPACKSSRPGDPPAPRHCRAGGGGASVLVAGWADPPCAPPPRPLERRVPCMLVRPAGRPAQAPLPPTTPDRLPSTQVWKRGDPPVPATAQTRRRVTSGRLVDLPGPAAAQAARQNGRACKSARLDHLQFPHG